jgi:hypothetical protein
MALMSIDPRIIALTGFGLTERQARFLLIVMSHAGVCVGRQYCSYARIVDGQNVRAFLADLVARGYATAYECGHNRARIYHVHSKALYRAIDDANNRFRRPTYLGRAAERLMILDAVLADPLTWFGAEGEKVRHFLTTFGSVLQRQDLPSITFRGSKGATVRYFTDKLPIGFDMHDDRYVFLFLITRTIPRDFRAFLQRHAELFRALPRWTLRLVIPRHLQASAALYEHAFRQELTTPLPPALLDRLGWYFRLRQAGEEGHHVRWSTEYRQAHIAFAAPRFRALYRTWCERGEPALHAARSPVIADAIQRRAARLERYVLPHTYHHLSPLVGTA